MSVAVRTFSAISSGGAVAGATDQVLAVRNGADKLVTPVALDVAQTFSALQTMSGGMSLGTTAYAVVCGGATAGAALQSVSGVGTSGQVLTSNGAGALPTWQTPASSGLVVGTTTVTGGTSGRVLYDNAGAVGEYAITGTGNVAMSASPTFTGTISAASLNLSSTEVITNDGLTTTVAYGLTLQNTTASLVGAQAQNSPYLLFRGHAWLTGSSADRYCDWHLGLNLAGGATVTNDLIIAGRTSAAGSGSFTTFVTFDLFAATTTFTGALTASGAFTCSTLTVNTTSTFTGAITAAAATFSGNVGIGLTSPGVSLHVAYDANTSQGVYPRGILSDSIDNFAHSAHVGGRKARGTRGSPATVQTNDYLAAFISEGYNGTTYDEVGYIAWVCEAITGGHVDSSVVMATATGNTETEFLRATSAGNVGIGYGNLGSLASINGSRFAVRLLNSTSSKAVVVRLTNDVDANYLVSISGTSEADKRAVIGPSTATDLSFMTNNVELARFTSGSKFTMTSTQTTGVTTASAFALNFNSLTTGTGLYVASSTLTSGLLVDLQVSGTAAAASQTVLNISTSGAVTGSVTTYGQQISNTHTGASATNVALKVVASGATTANIGLQLTGVIAPVADSTTAVNITKADGTTSVLNMDTTNSRIGIKTSAPTTTFQIGVSGDSTNIDQLYFTTYSTTNARPQIAGNWAASGIWGIGQATTAADNQVRIGQASAVATNWTAGSTLVLCVEGGIKATSAGQYMWTSSATVPSGSADTGLARNAAGVVGVTNGSSTTYATLGNTGLFLNNAGNTNVINLTQTDGNTQKFTMACRTSSPANVIFAVNSVSGSTTAPAYSFNATRNTGSATFSSTQLLMSVLDGGSDTAGGTQVLNIFTTGGTTPVQTGFMLLGTSGIYGFSSAATPTFAGVSAGIGYSAAGVVTVNNGNPTSLSTYLKLGLSGTVDSQITMPPLGASSSAAGGNLYIQAQNAGTLSGNNNGGTTFIDGGTKANSGTIGNVAFCTVNAGCLGVRIAAPTVPVHIFGTGNLLRLDRDSTNYADFQVTSASGLSILTQGGTSLTLVTGNSTTAKLILNGGGNPADQAYAVAGRTNGVDTNGAGANIILAAGASTGTGAGKGIVFKYAPTSTTTGTTLNAVAQCASFDGTGAFVLAQPSQAIGSTGQPTASLTLTTPAHTALTASTEYSTISVTAATQQFATGALTTNRFAVINAPTYGFVGSSTITNAATLAISGAPIAGTNATITNKMALWTQAGRVCFDQLSGETFRLRYDATHFADMNTDSAGILQFTQAVSALFNFAVEFGAATTFDSTLTLADNGTANWVFGTATGSQIATATGQKLAFWGVTPVVQQVLATGAGKTVDNVITFLQLIGLCKQS